MERDASELETRISLLAIDPVRFRIELASRLRCS